MLLTFGTEGLCIFMSFSYFRSTCLLLFLLHFVSTASLLHYFPGAYILSERHSPSRAMPLFIYFSFPSVYIIDFMTDFLIFLAFPLFIIWSAFLVYIFSKWHRQNTSVASARQKGEVNSFKMYRRR